MTIKTALTGMKVIDLSTNIAGPVAGRMFAEMGANVIKVEPPWGDEGRHSTTPYLGREGGMYLATNRNKRGIVINLKSREGREAMQRMLSDADVFVENMAPGSLKVYGLDYETLSARNPRLVYVSISGWGQRGPLSSQPGYAVLAAAYTGATAFPEGRPPELRGGAGDPTAPLLASWAAAVALLNRERTGKGAHVSSSIMQGAMHIAGASFAESEVERQQWAAAGGDPARGAGRGTAGMGPYATGDGQWVYLSAWNDGQFKALFTLIGHPEIAQDPAYEGRGNRAANAAELNGLLASWVGKLTQAEVLALARREGLPIAPMRHRFDELIDDEQVRANDAITPIEHPTKGTIWQVTALYEIDGEHAEGRPAPLLGQHTDEVLAEHGYTAAEITAMRASGAVA